MRKKPIALLLALIVSFATFVGCNNGDNSSVEEPLLPGRQERADVGEYISGGDSIIDPQDLSEKALPFQLADSYDWDEYNEDYLNYPFFTDKQDGVTYAVNGMWDLFSNITGDSQAVSFLGVEPTWYEWISRISKWTENTSRNTALESFIVRAPFMENGFAWNWHDSPHWPSNNYGTGCAEENYHYDSNMNYVLGVNNIVDWENSARILSQVQNSRVSISNPRLKHHEEDDRSVGWSVEDKVDAAMNYLMKEMRGEDGLVLIHEGLNDGRNLGRYNDFGSNYWDNYVFGYKSAYENILFYKSVLAMANIKRMCGKEAEAKTWEAHAEKVKKAYNDNFWCKRNKRYISWINADDRTFDYGMTFLNFEAIEAGLADAQQIQYIYSWLNGNRIIESDMAVINDDGVKRGATGKDIYGKFKFGARTNTVPVESVWETKDGVKEYFFFDWDGGVNVTTTHQFGQHFENGGAIFYPVYYDLMSRIKYISADNAHNRLRYIADEFAWDRLLRRPLSPLGNGDMIGIINEFPESGLVPTTYLYGFLGINPSARGLEMSPDLPSDYQYMGVKDMIYAGKSYKVTANKNGNVEIAGKTGLEFKLLLKNYADKNSVTVTISDGAADVRSFKVTPDSGNEFVIDLTGANKIAYNAVLKIE